MNKKETMETLKGVIDNVSVFLELVSGTTDYQRRKAAYYCVTTHFHHKFDKFPPFVLYGATGVGKSSLIDGMEPFCYNPVRINISQTTKASVREDFSRASPGTILVEESEDSTVNNEILAYLKGRYARTTAISGKMEPVGERGWGKKEYFTYGATIIHRRDHFEDQAMENRSIWLEIQLNEGRAKSSYTKTIPQDLVSPVVEQLQSIADIEFEDPVVPDHVPGRIVDTYEPILSLAQALDDKPFLRELMNELDIATAAFRDGQTYSPKVLVFKALLGCLTRGDSLDLNKSVSVEKDICKHLQNYYMQGMRPRTVAKYLRELGLKDKEHIRISGGVTKVTALTIPLLAKISQQLGVTDEILAKMAREGTIHKKVKTREDFELEV